MKRGHSVDEYARRVLAGELPAGRLVQLACQRHLRDRSSGSERGLWFDEKAASRAIDFIGLLPQRKGEWAGKALHLEPWQEFRIGSVFGWRRADGTRRFRKAYNEAPRKQGKTTEAAGVGNLLAWMDDEPGAEVYVAATKREQSLICWSEAKYQLSYTKPGSRYRNLAHQMGVNLGAHNLHHEGTATKFEPLSRDRDTADGLNIHGLVIDELHAWVDREYWGKLQTAQGARRQPLTWIITTAGVEGQGICREEHDYAVRVLEDVIQDDTLFAYIATVDHPETWGDEEEWAKANPNLGVSVKLDFLRDEYRAALEKPAAQNIFKRFYLDVWVGADNPWVNLSLWDAQASRRTLEQLAGADCFMGIDLSSTTDLTALVLWFPDGDGGGDLYPWFWVPGDNVAERARRDRVPYDAWIAQGLVEATPGRAVNYDFLKARALELATRFKVRSVGMDPWNGEQLARELEEAGLSVQKVPQNIGALSGPTKEIERLLGSGGFRHGGHPVLRWNAINAVAITDANENARLDKKRSRDRIDGLSAAVCAMREAMISPAPVGVPAVYFWPDEDDG